VSEEKHRTAADIPLPGGDFRMFITRLSFQGMLCLGLMENPVTGVRQVNLPQARMILDDLIMLQERTTGNLSGDEDGHLRKVVSDMQVMFAKVETTAGSN